MMESDNPQELKKKWGKIVVWFVILLIISALSIMWYTEVLFPPKLSPPPSWNEIIPGETTISHAVDILGLPNRVDESTYDEQFSIFSPIKKVKTLLYVFNEIYDPINGDTVGVELLVIDSDHNEKINVIHITYAREEWPLLSSLANEYGRPDFVTWGWGCHSRFLSWSTKGAAAFVNFMDVVDYLSRPWNKSVITSILLFEPMGRYHFESQFWPWALYPGEDPGCPESSYPDDPDPFDWDQIMTPAP